MPGRVGHHSSLCISQSAHALSIYNGDMSIRTGSWTNEEGEESHIVNLRFITYIRLKMAPGCTLGRRQAVVHNDGCLFSWILPCSTAELFRNGLRNEFKGLAWPPSSPYHNLIKCLSDKLV